MFIQLAEFEKYTVYGFNITIFCILRVLRVVLQKLFTSELQMV